MSLRDIAVRLRIDRLAQARGLYRATASALYFERGYRYARMMPAVQTPLPSVRPDPAGPLQGYAEAHSEGPGIFKWTHYFDIYDRHLDRFRGQAVNLVEIGVAGGGSLGLWRDYLGPSARICGIDIDPSCKRFESDGTEVVIGDQGDPAFWTTFLQEHPRIDIVIDDGGHQPEQQAATLESLLPSIQPGGIYVCEDIHGPFQPFHSFVDGLTRPLSSIGFATETNPVNSLQSHVASVHHYPIMTVIEKNAWQPATFESRHYGTEWPDGWPSRASVQTPDHSSK
jgi:hypothetical protein